MCILLGNWPNFVSFNLNLSQKPPVGVVVQATPSLPKFNARVYNNFDYSTLIWTEMTKINDKSAIKCEISLNIWISLDLHCLYVFSVK